MGESAVSVLVSLVTIFGMWLVARKDWRGWLVGICNQVLWLVLIIQTRAWGLLLLTATLLYIYAKALLQWRRDDATNARDRRVNRILWNEGGDVIDEIVLHEATVHVEQMSDRCWWIGVYLDDERYWMGNFYCDSRGRMKFTEQESAGIEWDEVRTHGAAR